jgi:hypothetical protein
VTKPTIPFREKDYFFWVFLTAAHFRNLRFPELRLVAAKFMRDSTGLAAASLTGAGTHSRYKIFLRGCANRKGEATACRETGNFR